MHFIQSIQLAQTGNPVINCLSAAPPLSLGHYESCPSGPLLAIVVVLISDSIITLELNGAVSLLHHDCEEGEQISGTSSHMFQIMTFLKSLITQNR